jgi:hypothetical protein
VKALDRTEWDDPKGETQEVAVEDRERVAGLLGHRIAMRLTNVEARGVEARGVEARGVEMLATLDEVRDEDIVLSEIGELGPRPTMFCPWDSLKRRVRERPPWLWPPNEEPAPEDALLEQAFCELREATAEEVAPEPPVERQRGPSAKPGSGGACRAAPDGRRDHTIALASLELFGEESAFCGTTSQAATDSGASSNRSSFSGTDLPETGELKVEVTRLVTLAFDEEAGEEVVEDSYDAPWILRFSI